MPAIFQYMSSMFIKIKTCGGYLRPGARPGATVGRVNAAEAPERGGRASGCRRPSENIHPRQEPESHPDHGEGEEGGV